MVRRPRRRRSSRRNKWLFALAIGVGLFILIASPGKRDFAEAEAVTAQFPLCSGPGYTANCVVDGDTIRIGERRIRLTGFDAPEVEGACQRESDLAIAARNELHRWLALGPFELSGGAEPPRDQYGRELRAARRREAYLADVMVSAGLAESAGWSVGGNAWC